MFNLAHAFLLFFCVVLMVRLTLPTRYVLLNPYAAMLDNFLSKLLKQVHTALPLPPNFLCLFLLLFALCADAVMLSRMQLNKISINDLVVFSFPMHSFLQCLLIAVLRFFHHLVMIWGGTLFLQAWHRSRTLPGYTGGLLQLVVWPTNRFALTLQWSGLLFSTIGLAFLFSFWATDIVYPLETMQTLPGTMGEAARLLHFSTQSFGVRSVVTGGLMIIEVFAGLHSITLNMILIALVCVFARSNLMSYFLNDVFNLLKGPLPNVKLGILSLTPLLLLLIFSLANSFLSVLLLALIRVVLTLGGFNVVQ